MNLNNVAVGTVKPALLLAGVLLIASCGTATGTTGDPGASGEGTPAAVATSTATAGTATDDACSLFNPAGLTAVFGGSVPVGKARSYGAGFSECVWSGTGKITLRISVVPFGNLAKDYAGKLTKIGPVPQLGDGATAFPGVVGIGHGSSGGATVGFGTAGGLSGILVAVRTESSQDKDLGTATSIAAAIRG